MAEKEGAGRELTEEDGRDLLRLARCIIQARLESAGSIPPDDELSAEIFQEKRGVFVTLHIDCQLRGCIGSLSCSETIANGVRRNAINAAFNDHRFSPLGADELDKVDLEVSILTEARPLVYKDGDDLVAKLRSGIDGVIIKQGPFSATFLPQVWDQLPEPENFLSHLCMKAGLLGDTWKKGDIEVRTYQVQCFAEKE